MTYRLQQNVISIPRHLSAFFSFPFPNFGLSNQTNMETTTFTTKKQTYAKFTLELISFAYVLLFLYASIYKLLDVGYFTRQLAKSPLIGSFSHPLAYAVPGIELLAVVLLLYPAYKRKGLLLSTVIMGAFTLYIAYVLVFAPEIPCACGGVFVSMGWGEHLVFNIIYFLAGILAIVLERKIKPTS